MITVEQIKGARGLLDWSQEELAKKSGVSKPTINNIERFIIVPRIKTIDKIKQAFIDAGIEFTEGPGVKFSSHAIKIRTFEGSEALFRLFEDIFVTLKNAENKELLSAGVDERKFYEIGGERFIKVLERNKKAGIKSKLLIAEGDHYLLEDKSNYRWCKKDIHQQVAYHVYGDTYAILLWGPPVKIVIIRNAQIASDYRKQFLMNWNNSKDID